MREALSQRRPRRRRLQLRREALPALAHDETPDEAEDLTAAARAAILAALDGSTIAEAEAADGAARRDAAE